MIDVARVQELLGEYKFDGWLLYDYRRINPVAHRLLDTNQSAHFTRRFAVWIPRQGEPITISHAIESHLLEHLPFRMHLYTDRYQWQLLLEHVCGSAKDIALEYSPRGELPSVSYVDGGTIEMLRSWGITLHTSADLLQHIEAVWTTEQIADNLITARKLRAIMMESFEYARILAQQQQTEYELQSFIMSAFEREALITDHPPIVAIGSNTANPHYEPRPERCCPLVPESLLLIDMWAKSQSSQATYADITWMAWIGSDPSQVAHRLFECVAAARNAALNFVCTRSTEGQLPCGYEVDDVARSVITRAGYGEYFLHRTGHNIGTEVHGYGANIDNFETHDTRRLLNGTSFSIEPGIYIPGSFGVRTECNVVISHIGEVLIPTEPLQDSIIILPL